MLVSRRPSERRSSHRRVYRGDTSRQLKSRSPAARADMRVRRVGGGTAWASRGNGPERPSQALTSPPLPGVERGPQDETRLCGVSRTCVGPAACRRKRGRKTKQGCAA